MSDDTIGPGDSMIDLNGVSLRDLDQIGESSLAQAIQALLDTGDDGSEPVAGFSARI